MPKPYKIIIVFLAVSVVLLVIAAYISQKRLANIYKSDIAATIKKAIENIPKEVKKGAENAVPLTAKVEVEFGTSFLTVDGVVKYTNEHRAQNGLRALSSNTKLNLSALRKAQDMFDKQYFEHDSPTGVGVDDLAKNVGYSYIMIGENLALGNFENDKVLVQGWMDSPGHRANILGGKYTEIGVAVLKGTYQGRPTWMAVQHFGKPLADCASPSENIKNQIEINNARLTQLESELSAQKSDLENTPKSDPSYNQKVESYNAKVGEYNALVEETKGMVNDYNSQIENFNKCAS